MKIVLVISIIGSIIIGSMYVVYRDDGPTDWIDENPDEPITYWTCDVDLDVIKINGTQGADFPSLIQTHEGGYMIAYDNDQIWIVKSEDGVDWSDPIPVSNEDEDPDKWALHPNLLQLNSGNFSIFYRRGATPGTFAIFSPDGVNWSDPVHIENVAMASLTTRSIIQLKTNELLMTTREGVFISVDGIHWDLVSPSPRMSSHSMIQTSDESILSIGIIDDETRNISTSTSKDGINWSLLSKDMVGFLSPSFVELQMNVSFNQTSFSFGNGSIFCMGAEDFHGGCIWYEETFFHFSRNGTEWPISIQFTQIPSFGDFSLIQKFDGSFMIAYTTNHHINVVSFDTTDIHDIQGPFVKD